MNDDTIGFPLHLHKLACQTTKGREKQQKQRDDYEKELRQGSQITTGKMACVICGAIGYMQDGKPRPVCKAMGYINTITCPHCGEEVPDTDEDFAQHELDCGSECGLTDEDLEIG